MLLNQKVGVSGVVQRGGRHSQHPTPPSVTRLNVAPERLGDCRATLPVRVRPAVVKLPWNTTYGGVLSAQFYKKPNLRTTQPLFYI